MAPPRESRNGEPAADVEIGAEAHARRLRFRRVPDTDVRFTGGPDQDCDSRTERENLPDEAEPHVTYRDIAVRWRAGTRLVIDEGDLGERQKRH